MQDRLNGMRVFAHVVEAKSFSAAAQELGISKSVASRHVSSLEEALSVKLLHRSTRKLSLTEAGAVFYEHCARIVQEAELAEQSLARVQVEPVGLVRITAVPAFATRQVLPALGKFHRKYPKIRVSLSCSNRTLDLGDEGFDLGIRVSGRPAPHLVARKLAVNRTVLCAAPSYLERHGTPRRFDDLPKHQGVLFPPVAPKGVWTLRRGSRKYAIKMDAALETDDMDAAFAAIVAGLGIGILPAYMAGDALRDGRLIPLLQPVQASAESGIYLVYQPNRTLALRVRALIDFFVAHFGPTPPWEGGW